MGFASFYINCQPDLPKIVQTLSDAFGVFPHEIEVAFDPYDSFHSQLNCEIQICGGEFPCYLQLTTFDHDILHIDTIGKIADFCELLGCVGFDFGPPQNFNEFAGMLIFRRENYQQVSLEPNPLVYEHALIIREYGKMFSHPDEWDDTAFIEPIE